MSNLYMNLDIRKFRNYINRLDKASRVAAVEAMRESIDELTKEIKLQTPKDTNTLVNSLSSYVREEDNGVRARVGFAIDKDPTNPKTGLRASQYVLRVHEDLDAVHPNGGKAKFLEDPVRDFQAEYSKIATAVIRKRLRRV